MLDRFPVINSTVVSSSLEDAQLTYSLIDTINKFVRIKNGGNPKLHPSEIIDADGNLYIIHQRQRRYAFMKWFSPVWDFVQIDCDLEFIKRLTVGDALEHMRDWTDTSARMIKKHLMKYDRDRFLDAGIYHDFMDD